MAGKHEIGLMMLAAVSTGLASVALGAASTATTYSGASPGNYNVAGNWSPSGVPGTGGSTVDASINGKSAALADDLSTATNLWAMSVYGGGTLTVNTGGYLYTASPGAVPDAWRESWLSIGSSKSSYVTGTTGGNLVINDGTVDVLALQFANDSTFTMNGGSLTARTRDSLLGQGAGKTFTANLNGGVFTLNQTYGMKVAVSGTANVTQNGATVYSNGGSVATSIGHSGTATWNLQSGDFYSGTTTFGVNAAGNGTINQTDGAAHFSVNLTIGGAGAGAYIISGGSFDTPNAFSGAQKPLVGFGYGDGIRSMAIGTSTGTGLFKIIGNDATINLNRYAKSTMTLLTLGANGTIAFDIDDATVSTIHVAGAGAATSTVQNASLAGIIDLNLINSYLPTHGATYDLLSATGTIINAGYSLADGDEEHWSLAIISPLGGGEILQATYSVPEPGSAAVLLGMGGLALLKRRHRVM